MPVALDPSEIYDYVFSTDRMKQSGEVLTAGPPSLTFHFPTGRETRTIARLFEAASKAQSVEEWMKLRCDAVRVILVGWRNVTDRKGNPVPYDPAKLEEILSDNDISELEARLLKEMSQSELDKKKFAFSALSNMEEFAAAAATGNAAGPAPSAPATLPASDATKPDASAAPDSGTGL